VAVRRMEDAGPVIQSGTAAEARRSPARYADLPSVSWLQRTHERPKGRPMALPGVGWRRCPVHGAERPSSERPHLA
jgi:hypothetical protein